MKQGDLVNVIFTDGHIEKGTIIDIYDVFDYKYRVQVGNKIVYCTDKDIERVK